MTIIYPKTILEVPSEIVTIDILSRAVPTVPFSRTEPNIPQFNSYEEIVYTLPNNRYGVMRKIRDIEIRVAAVTDWMLGGSNIREEILELEQISYGGQELLKIPPGTEIKANTFKFNVNSGSRARPVINVPKADFNLIIGGALIPIYKAGYAVVATGGDASHISDHTSGVIVRFKGLEIELYKLPANNLPDGLVAR